MGKRKIIVNGKAYPVIENLGYQAGLQSRVVQTEEGEKIAIRRGGVWEWWGLWDRLH